MLKSILVIYTSKSNSNARYPKISFHKNHFCFEVFKHIVKKKVFKHKSFYIQLTFNQNQLSSSYNQTHTKVIWVFLGWIISCSRILALVTHLIWTCLLIGTENFSRFFFVAPFFWVVFCSATCNVICLLWG